MKLDQIKYKMNCLVQALLRFSWNYIWRSSLQAKREGALALCKENITTQTFAKKTWTIDITTKKKTWTITTKKETWSIGDDNVLSDSTTAYIIILSKYYNMMIKQLLAIKKYYIPIPVLSHKADKWN